MKLLDFDDSNLEDVQPLFTSNDIYIFDRYGDGDQFEDETYIQNFRFITPSRPAAPSALLRKTTGGPERA